MSHGHTNRKKLRRGQVARLVHARDGNHQPGVLLPSMAIAPSAPKGSVDADALAADLERLIRLGRRAMNG